MSHVIVIGGGAAGIMAAYGAAQKGHKVTICEKNEKLGKKLYITGKGRCNVTNASDVETLLNHVVTNRKFLYSAFYRFTNEDMTDLLEQYGCRTKTERGNRVFPVSDKASDVTAALKRCLDRYGVRYRFHERVTGLWIEEGSCRGIFLASSEKIQADHVILATGGLSYPTTGSTGDGLAMAGDCGHKVTECYPALVPFEAEEGWVKELQGLALKNIQASILDGEKKRYSDFGEMLFTHFGVSGPVLLSASSIVGKALRDHKLILDIDLKPALSAEQLDARILRDFDEAKNKQLKNALGKLYPNTLIPVIIQRSGISGDKKVHEISRKEREVFVRLTKHFTVTLTGLRGFSEAIITQGGVSVKDVDPGTMESKRIKGLSFAGEMLDLDALTGGYNLQIAWSTGYLAGNSI